MPENRMVPPPTDSAKTPPIAEQAWAEVLDEQPVTCYPGPGQTGILWQAVQAKPGRYAAASGPPFFAALVPEVKLGEEAFPVLEVGDVVGLRCDAAGQATVVSVHPWNDETAEATPDHPPAGAAIGEWAQVIGLPIICHGGPEQIPLMWAPCQPVADAYSEPSGAPFFALIPPRAGSVPCVDVTDTLVLMRDVNGQAVVMNAAYLAVDEAIEEPFEEGAG